MQLKLIKYNVLEQDEFIYTQIRMKYNLFALLESGRFCYEKCGVEEILLPFDGMFFEKEEFYHRHVLSPIRIHLFRFEGENAFPEGKISFADKERIRSDLSILRRIEESCGRGSPHYEFILNDLAGQAKMECDLSGDTIAISDQLIAEVAEEIKKRLPEKYPLTELAAERGLSYVQFARRFSDAVGKTPSEYLAFQRLRQAERLLSDPAIMIGRVAEQCGFDDPYYFCNFFKKHKGISTSKWRKGLLI